MPVFFEKLLNRTRNIIYDHRVVDTAHVNIRGDMATKKVSGILGALAVLVGLGIYGYNTNAYGPLVNSYEQAVAKEVGELNALADQVSLAQARHELCSDATPATEECTSLDHLIDEANGMSQTPVLPSGSARADYEERRSDVVENTELAKVTRERLGLAMDGVDAAEQEHENAQVVALEGIVERIGASLVEFGTFGQSADGPVVVTPGDVGQELADGDLGVPESPNVSEPRPIQPQQPITRPGIEPQQPTPTPEVPTEEPSTTDPEPTQNPDDGREDEPDPQPEPEPEPEPHDEG